MSSARRVHARTSRANNEIGTRGQWLLRRLSVITAAAVSTIGQGEVKVPNLKLCLRGLDFRALPNQTKNQWRLHCELIALSFRKRHSILVLLQILGRARRGMRQADTGTDAEAPVADGILAMQQLSQMCRRVVVDANAARRSLLARELVRRGQAVKLCRRQLSSVQTALIRTGCAALPRLRCARQAALARRAAPAR